jgi:hypothetical protein
VSEKKVFLVAQGDSGSLYFRTSYYLNPVYLNPYATWSISQECKTQDGYETPRISCTEWEQELAQEGYDYVYLMHIDDSFIVDYGRLFTDPRDITTDQYYTVRVSGNSVRLKPALAK